MHWNELLGGCKCVWDFPVRTANRSQESGADISGSAQCRVKLIVHFYYEMIRIRIAGWYKNEKNVSLCELPVKCICYWGALCERSERVGMANAVMIAEHTCVGGQAVTSMSTRRFLPAVYSYQESWCLFQWCPVQNLQLLVPWDEADCESVTAQDKFHFLQFNFLQHCTIIWKC